MIDIVGAREAIPIADVQPVRIRGLVWCRARVRQGNSEWTTDWKWLVAGFCDWDGQRVRTNTADPANWYIPGFNDARDCRVDRIEITHYCDLPPPPATELREIEP